MLAVPDWPREESTTDATAVPGPGGSNRMMHRDAPPRGGAPGEVITSEIVERVFGLPTVVIEDPVTGSPLCVPAIS